MASGPGPGYGLPPADTGNFLLNWISRVLLVFIRVERRIDPFIRPASSSAQPSASSLSWRSVASAARKERRAKH